MSVNGTLVEDKMRRFKGECAHFTLDSSSVPFTLTTVPFSTNSHETDYSAWAVGEGCVPWTADADTLRTPAGGPVHNPAGLVH